MTDANEGSGMGGIDWAEVAGNNFALPTGELFEKGKILLSAAMAYWEEYQKVAAHDAVVWLQGDDGSLVVFTRGEYGEKLKRTVSDLDSIGEEEARDALG